MEDQLTLSPVAYYEGPLTEKFGLPRQSGLVPEIEGTLVFTPPYRMREAFRGMEGFSHLWLIWVFQRTILGPRRCVRPALAAMNGSAFLPPARLFGPIPWDSLL